ncbi:UvrB/UvrC motif-containing protein [Paenibacillus sp. OSY-SE]|uniref:UvrB/UvrC motif-containing protein n=1 Tax=Paenibacillus sp. OSY-SE TaxID=1196323 RepID=UPI0002D6BC1F|nr:UvrB/UvrC motif-containing protein [Paenibacillus sp. OSY-SE]
MICQQCGQKPATLHFTKIINGQKTEFHICESCAREKGEWIPGTSNGFSIHNLLSGLLDFDLSGGDSGTSGTAHANKPQATRCEKCGLTYSQFSKLGRFGCDECYSFFGDRLDPLLKRVHGNTVHIGKIPKRGGGRIQRKRELEDLKKQLQLSIMNEEFEQAAKLRDRIRDLEKNPPGAAEHNG